jgi:DNA-binding PadR family transcriptional regulator
MREALLVLLTKEPGHGRALHRRLTEALGAAGPAINEGQVYVTLGRLERADLVSVREPEPGARADRKVYEATASGREVAQQWLMDVAWRKVAPVDFHLKIVAAAATGTADPLSLIDAQRRELLRLLGQVQRGGTADGAGSEGSLLAEGTSLRLQADIRWLEVCERWAAGRMR